MILFVSDTLEEYLRFKNATGVLAAAHKSAMLTKYIFVRLPSAGGISDGAVRPAAQFEKNYT